MSILDKSYIFTADAEQPASNVPLSEKYMFYGIGEFNGGTLSLECSPDGVNWLTVDELTRSGRLIRYLTSGEKVRVRLLGAMGPVNVSAGIRQ